MIAKKTKKKGVEIIMPGNTALFQSNRITNAKYRGFSLMQSKLFVSIIKRLQEYIILDMNGGDYKQLELFNGRTANIEIGFAMSEIAHPSHYKEVSEAADALQTLQFQFKNTKRDGYTDNANLIAKISRQDRVDGKSFLYLTILPEVAEQLIIIDKNSMTRRPQYYTSYLYEVAMAAKSKYTIKLYWLLSSWKEKGGFSISYEKLREQLGINIDTDESGKYLEYPKYAEFKRFVLIPVQKDLEKKSNLWFHSAERGFETRVGKNVVSLNFKIITPEFEEENNIQLNNIRQLLKMHASFTQENLEQLRSIFTPETNIEKLKFRVVEIIHYTKENSATINLPQAYIIKSLLKEFGK